MPFIPCDETRGGRWREARDDTLKYRSGARTPLLPSIVVDLGSHKALLFS